MRQPFRGGNVAKLERPIIVLGAARSGTKMLRGLIGTHPDVSAVPWDVNFLWKYGNYAVPHDELTSADARPAVTGFIRRSLSRFLEPGKSRLVEKTVGNSLRPGFVRSVLPDAVFVHLLRDGRAVAESARRMWEAPLDVRAVLEKLRALPLAALPTYGTQYASAYAKRRLRGGGAVGSWGPRWKDIERDVGMMSTLELCAVQWARCVQRSRAGLAAMPSDRWIELRYEDLCSRPGRESTRLLEFLGLEMTSEVRVYVERNITAHHIEGWRKKLSAADLASIDRRAGAILAATGYR